jgi:hypothetical protein
VKGSAGVMAVVLGQTVAGGTAFLWLMPLWNEVKRGFFTLAGTVLGVLALAAWWSARAGALPSDAAGTWSVRLTLAAAVLVLVSTALLVAKRARPGRIAGLASVPVAAAALAAMGATSRQGYPLALFQLVAGAAFLGSVTDGLLLGHWYLTDRGLGRGPIDRFTTAMLAAVVVEALAVLTGGFTGTGDTNASLNPLLTAGALAPWIALGMVGTTLLIGVLTRAALRGTRSAAVQSATGFYYLAVVTAFTAAVAFATRFLPG